MKEPDLDSIGSSRSLSQVFGAHPGPFTIMALGHFLGELQPTHYAEHSNQKFKG
jgi:hypothetical protein